MRDKKKSLITKDQVLHVAGLANLTLTNKEIGVYTKQLGEILGYVEKLQEVDTSKVEPTYQTIDGVTNVWREDEVRESLSQEEALSAAGRKHEGYFVTEGVFGGGDGGGKGSRGNQGDKGDKENRGMIDKYNAVLREIKSIKDYPSNELKDNPFQTIGHKDLFLTKGIETTAGSRVLSGYIPQYSGTVVERLEKAGYKAKYKFNCDAWGHGSSGENSDFGATRNPWNREYSPGGSSSGPAAAVASRLVEFATGTDTGSSIRLPASFTNTTGIKPTYGAVSRYGVIAMASSLDSPGVIGRTAEEVEKIFGVMSGEDERDATTQGGEGKRGRRGIRGSRGTRGTIIGLPEEFFAEGIDKVVKSRVMDAAKVLEAKGFKLKKVSLPHTKYGIAVYYLVMSPEVASNLARYDGIRYGNNRLFFGDEAKRRIMLGTFASSAGYSAKFYEKAAKVRTLVIQDFETVFKEVDLLLAPVSPTPPFKLGEKVNNPLQMYLSDVLTVTINLAGLPGLTVPCGFYEERGREGIEGKEGERQYRGKAIRLPIGMQLIGPRWGEDLLFEVGKEYQRLTGWHKARPKVAQIINHKL